MAEIALGGKRAVGRVGQVDDADLLDASPYRWHVNAQGYVVTNIGRKKVRLHILLIGRRAGLVIDHRNGDKLDNRRSNLRFCTRSQNNMNARKRGRTSRFKGLVWDRGAWRVRIGHRNLGRFKDEGDAARAYDDAARTTYAEFALLNFSKEIA